MPVIARAWVTMEEEKCRFAWLGINVNETIFGAIGNGEGLAVIRGGKGCHGSMFPAVDLKGRIERKEEKTN